MMKRRRLFLCVLAGMATLVLAACSDSSANIGKYFAGRTLHVNVMAIERAPELRYATIDPEEVVRHWRIVSSGVGQELILVRMKVENHTAISAIVDVDQQAAELRDFIRGTFFPINLDVRIYQDLRDQPEVTVHMSLGQCFDPHRMYISEGTTVKWVNDGTVVHFVQLEPAGPDPVGINPGESFHHTFSSPETRDYQCSAQDIPGQQAQIVVEAITEVRPVQERSIVFIDGSYELLRDMGIDGWMVFEAPEGTEFRDFRWRAGDSITIPF